ncbi:MAG: ATP-binding protein [Candidatus Heimdallarchaeaceae archaeon]
MSENTNVKQVTVISGKGGTGKSSLIASLAYLMKDYVILADADVDAADLYLIYPPDIKEKHEYEGLKLAKIDEDLCTKCGLCRDACRFEAITDDIKIDDFKCEGCGLCYHVCPEKAISMNARISGHYMKSDTRIGTMIHARLIPGEESSGLLVSQVRKVAEEVAKEEKKKLVLIDGSPGIGCPVISSLTGSNLAVVVTEPTISALHDLKRILELLVQFRIPGYIVINKSDMNEIVSKEIEDFCQGRNTVIAKIPYNDIFNTAMIQKLSVSEIEDDSEDVKAIQETIKGIAEKMKSFLKI